jgi:hypothetical protein
MPAVEAIRERIWMSIREQIKAYRGDPAHIDARELAARLLAEHPGSGLAENQVALEFHRIRRAMRAR